MEVGPYAWEIQQVITDDLSELYISHTGTITKFPNPDPTEKPGNHTTTSPDHMTCRAGQEDCVVHKQVAKSDLPKSNSDYILMQSAGPVNPPT